MFIEALCYGLFHYLGNIRVPILLLYEHQVFDFETLQTFALALRSKFGYLLRPTKHVSE